MKSNKQNEVILILKQKDGSTKETIDNILTYKDIEIEKSSHRNPCKDFLEFGFSTTIAGKICISNRILEELYTSNKCRTTLRKQISYDSMKMIFDKIYGEHNYCLKECYKILLKVIEYIDDKKLLEETQTTLKEILDLLNKPLEDYEPEKD